MRAVFLSDAHLRTRQNPAYGRLQAFLSSLAGTTDRLFIAGDFFDFWFASGGRVFPEFKPIVDTMLALRKAGMEIDYCEGNHDFFLRDYFSPRGIATHPVAAEVVLEGRRVYVSHGDTVDRENRRYLFLRRLLRSRVLYLLQRYLPAALTWRLAGMSSDLSREAYGPADERLADVMEAFAKDKFGEGYDAVILGHCHKPLLKELRTDGGIKVFALLGDWVVHGSYVVYEKGSFSLRYAGL